MAVNGSGLFVATFVDILDNTQLAVDLTSTANKVALFTNSITPNFTTDTAYGTGTYAANEVSGTGYTAGGVAVANPTLVGASGVITYDQDPTVWSNSTITNARCALIYADGLTGNNAIALVDFGNAFSTSNGTFQITWNAAGVFTLDLVP